MYRSTIFAFSGPLWLWIHCNDVGRVAAFATADRSLPQSVSRRLRLGKNAFVAIKEENRARPYLSVSDNQDNAEMAQILDMVPIVERIAQYAATARGRQALLQLAVPSKSVNRRGESDKLLVKTANNAQQARHEYELVRQAMEALHRVREQTEGKGKTAQEEETTVRYPPLYGVSSSPWDLREEMDLDSEDWLMEALERHQHGNTASEGSLLSPPPPTSMDESSCSFAHQRTLECILRADQIVQVLLATSQWAQLPSTRQIMPDVAQLVALEMTESQPMLQKLHETIGGAVQVQAVKTAADPFGRRTYSFRLNEDKFPQLQQLPRQEGGGREDMETVTDSKMINGKPRSTDSQRSLGVAGFQILQGLCAALVEQAPLLDRGWHAVARLDVILARAIYGTAQSNGNVRAIVPHVGDGGVISVEHFVHPLLHLMHHHDEKKQQAVVPLDLQLAQSMLLIRGPNGGGKTVALKSFGMAALCVKWGIPLLSSQSSSSSSSFTFGRVDYFEALHLDLGDGQSVLEGKSTFVSKLTRWSRMLEAIPQQGHSLVLLDELGSGTDPLAGGAIGQAVLEELMKHPQCRGVSTTHSPSLQAFCLKHKTCESACMLLGAEQARPQQGPVYRMVYGPGLDSPSHSWALGAMSAISSPAFPERLLQRAAHLLTHEEEGDGEALLSVTRLVQQEKVVAENLREQAEASRQEAARIRDTMAATASLYKDRFRRLEHRLDSMYQTLAAQNKDSSSYQVVVGKTLAELRLIQQQVETEQEVLRKQGLRPVPVDYVFSEGEMVMITAPGEWQGEMAHVVVRPTSGGTTAEAAAATDPQKPPDTHVEVVPALEQWSLEDSTASTSTLCFAKSQVAIWDVPWNDRHKVVDEARQEKKKRLTRLLSDLSSSSSSTGNSEPTTMTTLSSRRFSSSRERKAAEKKRKSRKKK